MANSFNSCATQDAFEYDDSQYQHFRTESLYGDRLPSFKAPDDGTELTKPEDLEKKAAQLHAAAENLEHMAQVAWMQAHIEAVSSGETPPPMPGFGGMPVMMPGMFPPYDGMQMMPMHSPYPGGAAFGHGVPPPQASWDTSAEERPQQGKTTVMWKNLPNNYGRDELLALIESSGFAGTFNFFYSPIDFTSNALVGYAFIDFVTTEDADRFFYHFHGFTDWTLKSEKISEVTWSHPLQGLKGHIERYRNSPVMHPDVSDASRPVLYKEGRRIPFPPPTKKIRPPHLKDCRARG